MKKTKFEKIKEQQKKARNKEILYFVEQIFKYKGEGVNNLLKDIVTNLHIFGYLSPENLQKLLAPCYKIVEANTGNEVTKNE